ncbi:MAG: YCF48-related protein [Pseudomonadota bacterium]
MKTRALMVAGACICTALSAPPRALAQAVIDPLQREALASRKIDRAVLLSAASAGKRVVAVGERGIVALSDDQGKTWRQAKKVPTSVTLTIVKFVSEKSGWAAGHGGVVLQTADGGENWVLKFDGNLAAQVMLKRAQAEQQRGAPNAGVLVKQANALIQDGADKPFFDLDASDEKRAVVIGASGLIFSTADGGASWSAWGDRLENPRALNLYAIRRVGRNILVAGEQGLVLHSSDDGDSFTKLKGPYEGSWFAAASQGPDEFVVAGLRGNAYRVSGDGKTWTSLEGMPPVSLTSAFPVSANCTLLANQGGQLFSVEKSQTRAVRLESPSLPPVTATLRQAGGAWLAFTMDGIFQLGQLKNACSSASLLDNGKP